ncbi:class I SAM-dependent methyltransferase [uncultured Luteimonas sp.]|uniref:class I SAM-dependent methyltransferase n=1 Tax=uncultured Luteimonas sp. TaxID=453144 RepID=UPI00260EEA06|nr:class I SAM-dependent methyltransferase [uncultured Luteimonas sp.]
MRELLNWTARTPLHPQWLVTLLHRGRAEWIATRARGDTLDVGCADASIRAACRLVTRYVGLDYPATATDYYRTKPCIYGDARRLPIADERFDTMMLLDVAEHVDGITSALLEAGRILRRGGVLLITIPFAYPLHDQPHDYQRMTEYGLRSNLASTGFDDVQITEVGDAISAGASTLAMAMAQGMIGTIERRSPAMVLAPLVIAAITIVNLVGWLGYRIMPATGFMPAAYYVQARRSG